MDSYTKGIVAMCVVIAGFGAFVVACADEDGKGRTDLPEENISLDTDPMDVIVSADGFPNIGHKCRRFGEGAVVGMWTTTDRTLILVYNDHACSGADREQDMVVINGVPRAIVNAGTS
jgi:hypothetical protein